MSENIIINGNSAVAEEHVASSGNAIEISNPRISCTATLERAQSHLRELEYLEAHLAKEKLSDSFSLKIPKRNICSSIKELQKAVNLIEAIEKSSTDLSADERLMQYPNHTTFGGDYLWSVAKTCSGIMGLNKSFFMHKNEEKFKSRGGRDEHAHVDIVANNGFEWIKVSALSRKTIIWNFTKAGYTGLSSDESEEDDDEPDDPSGLLTQAKKISIASKHHIYKYKQPKIRFLFPRLTREEPNLILRVLNQIRDSGVTVETSEDIGQPLPIEDVIEKLITPKFGLVSDTLNLDYSVLKAFVSDVSFAAKEPEEYDRPWIRKQALMEKREPFLQNHIWPVCAGRRLICTRETLGSFEEILEAAGTEPEKARYALLFEQPGSKMTHEERIASFQALSPYRIPTTWCLPIEIIDVAAYALTINAPANVKRVGAACGYDPRVDGEFPRGSSRLYNASTYIYGWKENLTTITCNRDLWKTINDAVKRSGDGDGPDIWLAPAYRSLMNASPPSCKQKYHDESEAEPAPESGED